LQPFTVQVRRYKLATLRDAGICMAVEGRDGVEYFDAICEGREGSYHDRFGLDESTDGSLPPEVSIV
jgi:hypothetical protein